MTCLSRQGGQSKGGHRADAPGLNEPTRRKMMQEIRGLPLSRLPLSTSGEARALQLRGGHPPHRERLRSRLVWHGAGPPVPRHPRAGKFPRRNLRRFVERGPTVNNRPLDELAERTEETLECTGSGNRSCTAWRGAEGTQTCNAATCGYGECTSSYLADLKRCPLRAGLDWWVEQYNKKDVQTCLESDGNRDDDCWRREIQTAADKNDYSHYALSCSSAPH